MRFLCRKGGDQNSLAWTLWWLLALLEVRGFASIVCEQSNTAFVSTFAELQKQIEGTAADRCLHLQGGTIVARKTLFVGGGRTVKIFSDGALTPVLDGGNSFDHQGNSNDDGRSLFSVAGSLILENLTVQNGFAANGGALQLRLGTLEARGVTFQNNQAIDTGGVWYSINAASLSFHNCVFRNNSARGGGGGAGHATGNAFGHYRFNRCWFVWQTATGKGGALRFELPSTAQIDFYDVIFRNNTAASSRDVWSNSQSTAINMYRTVTEDASRILLGICSDGYYSNGGVCEVCPAGKYADTPGLTECRQCPPGKYLEDDGLDWRLHIMDLSCLPCAPGKASQLSGASSCSSCPPGKFSGDFGTTECTACTSGYAEFPESRSCAPCGIGTAPNSDFTACISCTAGFFSSNGASCEPCPAGTHYSFEMGSLCEQCFAGTYANAQSAATSCLTCDAGKSSLSGSTSCTSCPRGRAAPAGGTCSACSAGTFSVGGVENCTLCDAGNFSAEGAFQCTKCDAGKVSTDGSPSCWDCNDGEEASASQDACVQCPAGKKKAFPDKSCVSCGPTEFSLEGAFWCDSCSQGTISNTERTLCEECPNGTYREFGPSCQQCSAGSTPDPSKAYCNFCDPGRYGLAGDAACTACPQGRYGSSGTSCTPCPQGRFSDAIAAPDEFTCLECPSKTTLTSGSNQLDCITPTTGQAFECVVGKPCSISNFTGVGLVDRHVVMVKYSACDPFAYGYGGRRMKGDTVGNVLSSASEYGLGIGSDGQGEYISSDPIQAIDRRLQSDAVAGFGSNGSSARGSTAYSWTGTLKAIPGEYRLCWCGGLTADCSNEMHFLFEAGRMRSAGPFTSALDCVKGQYCNNKGPIYGVGLTTEDQVWVRSKCELGFAREGGGQGVRVPVSVSEGPFDIGSGELSLYFSVGYVDDTVPATTYSMCWCSSKGTSCSNMNLTQGSTSKVYLEEDAAQITIAGPGSGAETECFLGEVCFPELPENGGGVNLQFGDRLTAMEACGDDDLLRGLPGTGVASAYTEDGLKFDFASTPDSSPYLESYPGFFRLCWCRPGGNITCDQPSDFVVSAGLFIATGPYSGLSHYCQLGSRCIVTSAQLRGIGLATGDRLLPLADCVGMLQGRTYPDPRPVNGTVNGSSGYYFDLGFLNMSGNNPELLQLCWCSARSGYCNSDTSGLEVFRQVAMTFYVTCPPGYYELEVTEGDPAQCQECPIGYYCAGGWPALLTACPAGSVSQRRSSSSSDCLCRSGFFWDNSVGACVTCPVGRYKDTVGNTFACPKACPSQTTSAGGAANVWECFCLGNSIDTDPALESFKCTDLQDLAGNSSETDEFAAVSAVVYSFQGTLQVQSASTTALVDEIHQWLSDFLDTANLRASLELSVRTESTIWYVDFTGWSSDAGVAAQMQNKFDPAPFAVWLSDLTGTALDSASLINCTEVSNVALQCPSGLGLGEGLYVIDLSACQCPHGKQPAVAASTGSEAGCVSCPVGQYKSSVGDTSCVTCPTTPNVLTTLKTGAISYSACIYICPSGSAADPTDPSGCNPCGFGFYCPFKEDKQACNESQTTVDESASSAEECLCAPGFHHVGPGDCQACPAGKSQSSIANAAECSDCAPGTSANAAQATCDECAAGRFATGAAGSCDPCPAGRYSESVAATSLDSCVLCPIGKWSSEVGASSSFVCLACVSGSTTAQPGAGNETLCVKPFPGQSRSCISGSICSISIAGSSLQDGHRMAISSSACSAAKLPVSNIVSSGISQAATESGSGYQWSDVPDDFAPFGGVYNLCWCANMHLLTCGNLNPNFLISAGQMLVTGPYNNQLECLRGSDCTNLGFGGHDLLITDKIAVRRHGCGGNLGVQTSPTNVNGLGNLTSSGSNFLLDFGVSTADVDYRLYISPSSDGYFLCWCASARGLSNACAAADFTVNAGRLKVVGPNDNQESFCYVGQECNMTGIQGVSMQSGDRLMILSDCGRGNPIPGLPASGILQTADGSNFAFVDGTSVIQSLPGIFRICFCRPLAGGACSAADGFQARVGLMTANGPFDSTTVCELGGNCTISMSGIGLNVGDQVFLTNGACGSSAGLSELGFPMQNPSPLGDSGFGLEIVLGQLPLSAIAGFYPICWCPKSTGCATPTVFRASAGWLQIHCPSGTFAVGPTGGKICDSCTRGFYCAGGQVDIAERVACVEGRTTLSKGSVTIDACVCDRGFFLVVASNSCVECPTGSYKPEPGNLQACTACPSGTITYFTGSVSPAACVAESISGSGSTGGTGDTGGNTGGNTSTTSGGDQNTSNNSSSTSNSSNSTNGNGGGSTTAAPAAPVVKDSADVPAVAFNMSLGNFPVTSDVDSVKVQVIALFRRSLSTTSRLPPSAISVEIVGLEAAGSNQSSGRRLATTSPVVVIVITQRTAEEAAQAASDIDVNTISTEVSAAVASHPTLGGIGLEVAPLTDAQLTSVFFACPRFKSIPPGVPPLTSDDCRCSVGYGFDLAAAICEPCLLGEYKETVGDVICDKCPELTTTFDMGATLIQDCDCQAGLYRNESGNCAPCPLGFYCPGGPQATECPAHSTTLSPGRALSDCICLVGHYYVSADLFCQPCQRGRYKPQLGNAECALTCPTNADSELGATSLDNCFCNSGFYATFDDTGQLATCVACTFSGILCEGGFVLPNLTDANATLPKVHSQPFARPGFYQTGHSSAVECNILLPDGSSVCHGGSACLAQRLGLEAPAECHGMFGSACNEGSTGLACGECAKSWSRDKYPEPCSRCMGQTASVLAVEILLDIFQRAFLGFVVAALAASSAVKGQSKLHISMIRIGSQWLAACSVITQFNLGRLPAFEWVQRQQQMDQLEDCAATNATCDIGGEAIKFPWPPEFTDALREIFNVMGVVPKLVSVDFTVQCHAEFLMPDDSLAKVVAPAIYHVSSPVISMFAIFVLCALIVYCVVPCGRKLGLHFNNVSIEKKKKERALAKLKSLLAFHISKHGLTWHDIEDSMILEGQHASTLHAAAAEPEQFVIGTIAKCRPLAAKMCWHEFKESAVVASSLSTVKLTLEEFLDNTDFLLQALGLGDDAEDSLGRAAIGEIPEDLLALFVHRALAWKMAAEIQSDYPRDRVAEAVVAASTSAENLWEQSAKRTWGVVLKSILLSLRDESEVEWHPVTKPETEALRHAELDPATLDFGLFTSLPGPMELLSLCTPVFWVTLLAMWPELLRAFLQMIWCASISGEDADGKIIVQQRMLPHPDVVCWSQDHFASMLIAGIGLGIWCFLVPVVLFWRIYRLRDRQSAENMRKYGYFCEGYEPQFWWWDILVKRADIGLMNIVTYTSIARDGKAKLLLFPFVSGCMLAVASWYQPFANTQAEILDFLEMCLLSFRFFLFSFIAVLLIFNPSAESMWVLAFGLAIVLATFCTYFGLHILVQILRSSVKIDEDDDEHLHTNAESRSLRGLDQKVKDKGNLWKRISGKIKKKVVKAAVVLLQERSDEKFVVEWSAGSESFDLITAAELDEMAKRKKTRHFHRIAAAVKDTRSKLFHFGLTYHRKTVIKAFEEFTTLWLVDLNQKSLPTDSVQVVCALTTALRHVPTQIPRQQLAMKWRTKVVDMLHQVEGRRRDYDHVPAAVTWRFVPDDILDMTARLSKLSPEEARWLVDGTLSALRHHRTRFAETQIIREEIEEMSFYPSEGQDPEETEALPALPTTMEKAIQTSLTSAKKRTKPIMDEGHANETGQQEDIPLVEGIVPRIFPEEGKRSYSSTAPGLRL